MKFAIVVLAVVAAASAQVRLNQYNPFQPTQYNPFQQGQYNRNPGQYNPFQKNQYNRLQYTTPTPFRPFVSTTAAPILSFAPSTIAPPTAAPVRLPVAKVSNIDARNAKIVRYDNEINPDGSYSYSYETDNGIAAEEQGVPRNFGGNPPVIPDVATGGFSYTSPEGVPVSITYIADENGFQPQGNVIPVPPPIPILIQRSLEYNARNAPSQ